MATDCIDEELIEQHSGNGGSAKRPKILAIISRLVCPNWPNSRPHYFELLLMFLSKVSMLQKWEEYDSRSSNRACALECDWLVATADFPLISHLVYCSFQLSLVLVCTPSNLFHQRSRRFRNVMNVTMEGVQRIEGKEYCDIDSTGAMPLEIILSIPYSSYRFFYNCPNYPIFFRVISYQRTRCF